MKHKLITLIISIAAMIMISPCANAKTYSVSTSSELLEAVSNASTSEPTVITITSMITVSGQMQIKKGMDVTIRSTGNRYIKRSKNINQASPVFRVYDGGTLTFSTASGTTFTLDGNGSNTAPTIPLIYSTGTLNINKNVLITNCKTSSGSGSAIRATGGTVNISGATITGNESEGSNGGAVSLSNVTATVKNAVITNNTANGNGGGIYMVGTTATIADSEISGNTAVKGNGIYIADSTSTKSSVTFSGAPQISDTIYNRSSNPVILASDFDESSYLKLDLPSYTIGKVVASCEKNPENYIDHISFVGTDYSTRADNSNLLLTKRFTVNFKDFDGSFLKSQYVYYNESATAPEEPVRDGYKFIGWDTSFDNVVNNMTVTAQYKKLNTTELFVDGESYEFSYSADSAAHTVTAEAYSDQAKLILAVYKNGVLTDCILSSEPDENQKYSTAAEVVFEEGVSVKAMLWQDFDSLVSLSETEQFYVEESKEEVNEGVNE